MGAGQVVTFGGKALGPGEHTYYTDKDGNERRANYGDAVPVEKVANAEHFVTTGRASIANATPTTAKSTGGTAPGKESAL